MTKAAEQLLQQVMELEPADRHEIVEQLEADRDRSDDPVYDAEWDAEIRRRIDDFESGKVEGVLWEQVRTELGNRKRARK